MAYWEEYIIPVHQHHDEASNACVIVPVAREHEHNGDDMVGHHLHMVFPSRLGIKDQDLMKVEGSLSEIVKLERSGKGKVWVIEP